MYGDKQVIEGKKVLGLEKKFPPLKGLITSDKSKLIIQKLSNEEEVKKGASAEGARNFLLSLTLLELYSCIIAPSPGDKCLKSMLNY